jgi:hypothetical protein
MSESYKIYNETRHVVLACAIGYWKEGEYDLNELIKGMSWSQSDIISVIGEYGHCNIYQHGKIITCANLMPFAEHLYNGIPPPNFRLQTKEESEAENKSSVPYVGTKLIYVQQSGELPQWQLKYWCEIRQCAVDEPYQYDEYQRLLASYQKYLNESKESLLKDVASAFDKEVSTNYHNDVVHFIWDDTESETDNINVPA